MVRDRSPRWLATAYAGIELVIGLYGAGSVPLLRRVNGAVIASGADTSLVGDFFVNLGVLLLPTFLMGLTTPIIIQLMKTSLDALGRTTGRYYGLNILGAATGAIATGLVLIELLGLVGSTVLAAAVNVLLAVLVIAASRNLGSEAVERDVVAAGSGRRFGLLLAGLLFGFVTLTLQMLYFRVLANFSTLAAITFPVILTAYLILMSVGQVVGGRIIDRANSVAGPFVGLFAVGSALLVVILLVPPTSFAWLGGLVVSPSFAVFLDHAGYRVGDPNPFLSIIFALIFMIALVPFTAFFPMLTKLATERIGVAGSRFAEILAATTLGNVLGAFVTGLVLLEKLGTINTFRLTLVVTVVAILCVIWSVGKGGIRQAATAAASLMVVCLFASVLLPGDYYKRFSLDRFKITEVIEGKNGVVSIVPTDRFFTLAAMFRTESGLAMTKYPERLDSYQAWRVNMAEAMALDPSFRPKRILVLGLGHAYGIRAMLDFPFVEKIVVVEISHEIVDAVRRLSAPDVGRIFSDPRVEVVVQDGRRYIQKAINRGERFDLVEDRINEPWRAGSSNLFTKEFFTNVKAILAPGGHLAVREMANHIVTALEVFRSGYWVEGCVHAFFSDKTLTTSDRIELANEIRKPFESLRPGEGDDPRESIRCVALSPGMFGQVTANTDDRPVLEYYWLRQLSTRVLPDREFLSSKAATLPMKTVSISAAD